MTQKHLNAGLKLLCIAIPVYIIGAMLYVDNSSGRALTRRWNPPITCDVPSGILYGIFTTAGKVAQRQVFRELMVPHSNVTVKFVIGTPGSDEDFLRMAVEQATFGDIMVLDCVENMNEGKTYTYFKTVSPCFSNYIKADDDTAVNLERLYAFLNRLDSSKPKCIGRMIQQPFGWLRNWFANVNWYYTVQQLPAGMLYCLNGAAVQKLSETDFSLNDISGDEDRRTAYMMQGLGVEFVDVGTLFHDHPAYNPLFIENWHMDISNLSVAVHQCKTIPMLYDAFEKLL